jgi:hypothetical protein
MPLTFQVTDVFEVPLTLAENCCCPPVASTTWEGETPTETAEDEPIVITEVAVTVTSAREVAVTVTFDGEGAFAGAVYSPSSLIVPHVIPLHPVPVTLQMTTPSVVPLILATNCI